MPSGDVEVSATGLDPRSEAKPELDAQKGEALAEGRNLIGGEPGGDAQPANPRTVEDAAPASAVVGLDPKEAKRRAAQKKLRLMNQLPSEVKVRVARRELALEDALREAGIEPDESG